MIEIIPINKGDDLLQYYMSIHYSQPKGFVGRQLFYKIVYDRFVYGCIGFGSATKFLPGRTVKHSLNCGMNNIFYHVEKQLDRYPIRNFTTKSLLEAEIVARRDYWRTYGYKIKWIEALVEYPRTGDLYIKAGYKYVGDTKGFTCKREAGTGSDSWSGKRVWDTTNLRPKRVFIKEE